MEICDVVDGLGMQTGKVVERGTHLEPDEFYLVVHIWIRDEENNYLIQQRGLHLASAPGVWATTVGYVISGETSLDAAIREVHEELGLKLMPTHLQRVDRHVLDNRVEDIWVAEISRKSMETFEPGYEVADCKWVPRMQLEDLVEHGEFFRYSYHGKFF